MEELLLVIRLGYITMEIIRSVESERLIAALNPNRVIYPTITRRITLRIINANGTMIFSGLQDYRT